MTSPVARDLRQDRLGVGGFNLELHHAVGLLIGLAIEIARDHATIRIPRHLHDRVVRGLDIIRGEVEIVRRARGDVREVVERQHQVRLAALDLRPRDRRLIVVALLLAMRFQPRDTPKLLQSIQRRPRRIRRNLRDHLRSELSGVELLQFAFDDPPLGIVDRLDRSRARRLDILGLHAHVHVLGLLEHIRLANVSLKQRDVQRRKRDQVVVIAKLAFRLLDLLSPDGQLLLRGQQILNLALRVLDDVEQPLLHRLCGAKLGRGVGVLLGHILRGQVLALADHPAREA